MHKFLNITVCAFLLNAGIVGLAATVIVYLQNPLGLLALYMCVPMQATIMEEEEPEIESEYSGNNMGF